MSRVNGSKLYVLDCGYTMMDSNFIVAMDTFMTESEPDAPRRWHKCPTYSVLIQHPTGIFCLIWEPGVIITSMRQKRLQNPIFITAGRKTT